jgi:pimeloyl-ACP methyl ester carboxylesterase
LLMGLPALATAGTIYQLVATKRDQRKLGPAPGEMVSVGNHKLHINCMGEGSPTVILESGAPATSIEWSAWVQPEVAKATRVCAYDRAGLGWSESGPGPRDAEQITSELHTLLENAGIESPYILVGHSVGGHHVRVYAERYPDEVAGMVLVDVTHG